MLTAVDCGGRQGSADMNFGVAFANIGSYVDPEEAICLARAAETAGFESIWTVDHVVVPAGYQSTYPYDPSGRLPSGEGTVFPDPLIWLAYVAARTSTLRLGTGILIVPQRNPLVLAKELATLDHLSGGRMVLGVGIGWLEEIPGPGSPLRRPRPAHRGGDCGHASPLVRGAGQFRGQHGGLHRLLPAPAAPTGNDPRACGRAQSGGRPPGRSDRRRVLSFRRQPRRTASLDRHRPDECRRGREGPDDDRSDGPVQRHRWPGRAGRGACAAGDRGHAESSFRPSCSAPIPNRH